MACVGFLLVDGLDAGSLGLSRGLGEAGTLIVGSALFMGGTHWRATRWAILDFETPWLEEQYGTDYRRYRERHPRLLGRSSVRTPAPEESRRVRSR